MTSRDIALSPEDPQPGADVRRWSAHVFLPDERTRRATLGQQENGCAVRTPTLAEDPRTESQWPPDIFFDAVYASMVLKHFGAPEYSQISRAWVERGFGAMADAEQQHQHRRSSDSLGSSDVYEDGLGAGPGDTLDSLEPEAFGSDTGSPNFLALSPYTMFISDERIAEINRNILAKHKAAAEEAEAAKRREADENVRRWMQDSSHS